ncbi:putative metal-dependent protease of the PAD1/JAB1 superfamily [Geoglobus ahangari]|uniref:Putative metal-dependent protease of the PAD1/JAB1 superfamily n=1 Tax=Geoglobus ahangari TaxID=113653 RepID=A0A0F7DBZ5_9EURY|nr:Mov34/MPN/PAD-1 family protein [Geoglobus ahangari]AKG91951.1 putative metal-dependent protease of the PAD1/JAB1 superfamily [Geoglobus ahangari]
MAKRVIVDENVEKFLQSVAENPGEVERCGLLVGRAGKDVEVVEAHEVENVKASAVEFELNPVEVLRVFERAEQSGLDVVGVWHTHPVGYAKPSGKDAMGASVFPGVWVIIARGEVRWYLAGEKGFEEAEVEVRSPRSAPSSSPSS